MTPANLLLDTLYMVGPARSIVGVVLGMGLIWVVGVVGRPAHGQQVPRSYVEHFFGAVHLGAGDMHFADDVGVCWSRHGVRWHQHQPQRDGSYDFSSSERLLRSAQAHDVEVMPVLGNLLRGPRQRTIRAR